ncbi:acyl-CoA dehydrogenase [Roseovarius sp. Pro17]|uniref:acyl-CoA dehydrogenase n=1 Tax=Roseovarius sp. Pro17 TaxID=3108175 RepID=UPI002D786029|nr:acyl-CoA dehydrogenase [Roseovarius sp. Pro17]
MMPLSTISPATPSSKASQGDLTADLLAKLLNGAEAEEAGTRPIGSSIDLLRSASLLNADRYEQPDLTARMLMRVGAANLSVGRLWEGHINASALIDLYGSPGLKCRVRTLIAQGAFLGVWGADADVPVTWTAPRTCLNGAKMFASGLGTVTHAVVTVNSGPEVCLALVDVSDMARADAGVWNMHGMRATASGRFDFTDCPMSSVDWLGEPGDYLKEPHFVGGVWRIAALQAGAAIGLVDRAAAQLRAMDRMQAEPQKARLMPVLMRAWAGSALVERAALATIDTELATEQIVSTSISARLLTEEIALDAIRAVEQSIGLQHFAAGSQTGRMARDLAVYLRQAARDAFQQRASEHALGREGNAWGVFG